MHAANRVGALVLSLWFFAGPTLPAQSGNGRRYLEDYDFVADTVRQNGAAIQVRKIDWKAESARLRPLFAACDNDQDHVRNVMELLAVLQDAHTGVTRTSVQGLPSKFDGLYGGGLWICEEQGRLLVRGILPGHALEKTLPLGSMIIGIQRQPAWLAMGVEERRITRYSGISTRHSLYGSLGNRLLPFHERRNLELQVVTPDGTSKQVTAPRWGPNGKAFSPSRATMPDGVEPGDGAVSAWLPQPWCEKLAYLRITGAMNASTVQAFHRAFDARQGMQALLLDCRSMGGGGDSSAWEMAGRLYSKGVDNGRNGRIEPSGSWQFDGPVVMLQDELEVSSAETFTWAVSETGRVLSVGRATGGWGIIPRGFDCPSGLLSFRLGVTDRPTPIRGIHTEGVGWPADVTVPRGPLFCQEADPDRNLALQCLRLLHRGMARQDVVDLYQGLFDGDVNGFRKGEKTARRFQEDWSAEPLATRFVEDLEATIRMELEALDHWDGKAPDAWWAAQRVEALRERAGAAGAARFQTWAKKVKALKKEAAAQEALLALVDGSGQATEKQQRGWLSKHRKTATGRWVEDRLWK